VHPLLTRARDALVPGDAPASGRPAAACAPRP